MAAVATEAYLDLEGSTIDKSVAAIDKVASSWATDFGAAMEGGDLNLAATMVENLDLSGAAVTLKKPVLLLSNGLATYGATQVVGGDTKDVTIEPLADPIIILAQQFVASSLVTAQNVAQASASQMIANAASGLVQKAEGDPLKPLKAAMNSMAINMSQLSSRLASYGFLLQATTVGEVIYELSAVLDDRTSDFCRAIHGKIIPVEVGLERAITVLGATTPEEAAALAPWPKIDSSLITQIQDAGYKELVAMGLYLPPFHPYCRTILQFVTSSVKNQVITEVTSTGLTGGTTASTVATSSNGLTNLLGLGLGVAAIAALVGEDNTSALLPGVSVDVVQDAIEDIKNGATILEIMQRYNLTMLEVLRLRELVG